MLTVSEGHFKDKVHEYCRKVRQTGEGLIITDKNRPILKIIPLTKNKRHVDDLFADLRGKVKYSLEDLLKPDTEEWGDI